MAFKLNLGRRARGLILAGAFPFAWATALIVLEDGHRTLALVIGASYLVALTVNTVGWLIAEIRRDRSDARARAAQLEAKAYVVETLNDDLTPMEVVVEGLQSVFGMSRRDAITTMLLIHESGSAVCSGYGSEAAAREKAEELEAIARARGFPLACRVREGDNSAVQMA